MVEGREEELEALGGVDLVAWRGIYGQGLLLTSTNPQPYLFCSREVIPYEAV